MNWQTDIGIEIHVQLNTLSKLFSGSSTKFGASPNTNTSYIDAGFPGTLPVLNSEAVTKAITFAIATSADINNNSYFERKNYFYPDLPKGYQITQNSRPIISNGQINIVFADKTTKSIKIHHAHLEEDAGKLIHDPQTASTYVDLNRAGNPLLEIVTTPCLNSAEETVIFLKEIHNLVRFINICDGNMQEGSFRCDINISVRPKEQTTFGTKTEIKNLNSFKFIEKAINFEIQRQKNLLTNNQKVQQETRLYCPDTNKTIPMRTKETAADYRYFTEPDLLPIEISEIMVQQIKNNMPKLPQQIAKELEKAQVNEDSIGFVLNSAETYNFYQDTINLTKAGPQQVINWLKGPYTEILNAHKLTFANPPVSSKDLALLLDKITLKEISNQTAKTIFSKLIDNNSPLADILKEYASASKNPNIDLNKIIKEILDANPEQVSQYKAGKEKVLAFFIGQAMKCTKGQAEAQEITKIIKAQLS